MPSEKKILADYSDLEKGAYIGAISSIATADHTASEEELNYIMALAESANLSEDQKHAVQRAANELTGTELKRCLDILKDSDLKYSLVTDLISFAESDKKYTPEERENIEKIADYLQINKEEFSLLDEFVQKTNEVQPQPEEMEKPGFLSALGLDKKFNNSGIKLNSLTKGLLGIAGPLVLANLLRKKTTAGRGLNPLGGLASGIGGGGLSSIISMLSGGRGFSRTGNLFNRLFGLNR